MDGKESHHWTKDLLNEIGILSQGVGRSIDEKEKIEDTNTFISLQKTKYLKMKK